MTTVSPDDIPTSVTKLVYTAPWVGDPKYYASKLSQNEIAAQLAHYWPAIEQHIREQVAQELLAVDPVDWALAGQHAGKDAAAIARGTDTTRSS